MGGANLGSRTVARSAPGGGAYLGGRAVVPVFEMQVDELLGAEGLAADAAGVACARVHDLVCLVKEQLVAVRMPRAGSGKGVADRVRSQQHRLGQRRPCHPRPRAVAGLSDNDTGAGR